MKKQPEQISFDIDMKLLGEAQASFEAWMAAKENKKPERIPVTEVIEEALTLLNNTCRQEMARLMSIGVDLDAEQKH